MQTVNKTALQKAQAYAFLLLKFRLRSRHELYERLKKKKFEEGVIRECLDFLEERHFIDDSQFVKAWANSRLKKNFGVKRIAGELRLKGISKQIIDSYISKLKEDYSEVKIVEDLAFKRMERLKDLDPQVAKRRLYSYLMRRGFSSEAVSEAINNL